ncbi:hypothetical protein GE118_03015 [Mycoplasma sp. NEAQ87857]|uniref:hypothetical protein n=1 Tax=Mycoplasma sp. NEAQ87857 TaxID=2683967 RepID=UPI001318483B|nr:hypothetical protein [Mycoplasma sp. NEAQ87857]QGZ97760.1 hypothetical protein GE118_03015 [Mycoplasma sp. NEAQ87857]
MKNKFNANLVNLYILQVVAAIWFILPILINIAFIDLPKRTIIFNYISLGIACFFQLFFIIYLISSIKKGMRLQLFYQDFKGKYDDLFIEKFRHITAYIFNRDLMPDFCYKGRSNLKKMKYKQPEYVDSIYLTEWKDRRLKYLSIWILIFNWLKCWTLATYVIPFFLYLPIVLMLGTPRPNYLWILVLSTPGIALVFESFIDLFLYKISFESFALINNPYSQINKFIAYMNRYSHDYNRVIFSKKNRLRYIFIHRFTNLWEYFNSKDLICYDDDDVKEWIFLIPNFEASIETEQDQEVIDRVNQKILEYQESKANKERN